MTRIIPFSGFNDLAAATATYLTSGSVALSGGSTYASLFPHWIVTGMNFTETTFFPVDERLVPFNDPQGNWGTAYRLFLSKIGREQDKKHHPLSVEQYIEVLQDHFCTLPPIFDTVFLGVGNDGHTASLFPGNAYLDDTTSTVMETISPIPPHARITLAPIVLTSAKNLVVIIAGISKKAIYQRIIDGDDTLPIIKILKGHPKPILFVKKRLVGNG